MDDSLSPIASNFSYGFCFFNSLRVEIPPAIAMGLPLKVPA